jgi:Conjugal transfer protein TraD
VQQLGKLVIATRADSLSGDQLAGALIMLAEIKDTATKQAWQKRVAAFFQSGRGELHWQLSATLAALEHNRAARNRQEAAKGGHDMRAWQKSCRQPIVNRSNVRTAFLK